MSKFKDFSKTSKSLSNSFQGLNVDENTDLSVKSLLQNNGDISTGKLV